MFFGGDDDGESRMTQLGQKKNADRRSQRLLNWVVEGGPIILRDLHP